MLRELIYKYRAMRCKFRFDSSIAILSHDLSDIITDRINDETTDDKFVVNSKYSMMLITSDTRIPTIVDLKDQDSVQYANVDMQEYIDLHWTNDSNITTITNLNLQYKSALQTMFKFGDTYYSPCVIPNYEDMCVSMTSVLDYSDNDYANYTNYLKSGYVAVAREYDERLTVSGYICSLVECSEDMISLLHSKCIDLSDTDINPETDKVVLVGELWATVNNPSMPELIRGLLSK